MPIDPFSWQQGLYFKERLPYSPIDSKDSPPQRRIDRWMRTPFTVPSIFEERLKNDDVSEDQLHQLLAGMDDDLSSMFKDQSDWAKEISEALNEPLPVTKLDLDAYIAASPRKQMPLIRVVRPLIARGIARLEAGLDALLETGSAPFDRESATKLWLIGLPEHLTEICDRSMVLELNVARVEEVLKGETGAARFAHFLELIEGKEKRRALLEEYIVMARLVSTRIKFWVKNGLEFFSRLQKDWALITDTFFKGQDPGSIVDLTSGIGDSHRQGHSVISITFEQGKLIYKPRSVASELEFKHLLQWLNDEGFSPSFKTFNILERENYGWVAYMDYQTCQKPKEIHNFYTRMGAQLALLYMLDANDFHRENVIAHGEHPILIDMESLFQPRLNENFDDEDRDQASYFLRHSIDRVGFLPRVGIDDNQKARPDASGLNNQAGSVAPVKFLGWSNMGTDEMQLAEQTAHILAEKNVPMLGGQAVNPAEYIKDFEKGFIDMYRFLSDRKSDLLDRDGPLKNFAEVEIRVIYRATMWYVKLLRNSYHPDFLRNGLERDRYLDRLWGGFASYPDVANVIAYEKQDLIQGDVPIFTARPNSRDVWASDGTRLENLLGEVPFEVVRDKIRNMNEAGLQLQLHVLKSAMISFEMSKGNIRSHVPSALPPEEASTDALLMAAEKVGQRLDALTFEGKERASWLGISLVGAQNWNLSVLDTDLFNGLPGVALFLGYLGKQTKQKRYLELASKTLTMLEKLLRRDGEYQAPSVLGISGLGGLVHTYTHLGVILGDPKVLENAKELAMFAESTLPENDKTDIIGGLAGLLLPVINLYKTTEEPELLTLATQLGDDLLTKAQTMATGKGWINPGENVPLAGYSHGISGIAHALTELYELTGSSSILKAVREALDYERTTYDPEVGNWADLRSLNQYDKNSPTQSFMMAWCHGAPGVGMARVKLMQHLPDESIQVELKQALIRTKEEGFGFNHSICHGELGNLELLLSQATVSGDEELRRFTYRAAARILEDIEQKGWMCGVPLGTETPGLFTGLAGIGYGLLRLVDPHEVPCVLTLDPPPSFKPSQT